MSSPCSSRPVSSVTVTRSPRFTNSGSSWKQRASASREVDFGESWAEVAGVPCKVK